MIIIDQNINYLDAWPLISVGKLPVFLNIDHNCDQVQFFLSVDNNNTNAILFLVRNATIPILKRRMHLLMMFYNHLKASNVLEDDVFINFSDLLAATVTLCPCGYICPVNCIH